MKTYTTNEVATLLNVNAETIRRWTRDGKLIAKRQVGRGGTTISHDAIEKFLEMPCNKVYATNFVRSELMRSHENENQVTDKVEEPTAMSNDQSREVLKSTLINLIAMRDNLNRQIDEIIQLL